MKYKRLSAVLLFIAAVLSIAAASVSCGSGWEETPTGDACYKFVTNSRDSWCNAQSRCRIYGGNLATFRNWGQLIFVKGYISTHIGSAQNYWIGGKRIGHTWYWEGNSLRTLGPITHWAPLEPSNPRSTDGCMQMWAERSYQWDDDTCSGHKAFVCEKYN